MMLVSSTMLGLGGQTSEDGFLLLEHRRTSVLSSLNLTFFVIMQSCQNRKKILAQQLSVQP